MIQLIQKVTGSEITGDMFTLELDGKIIACTWGHITKKEHPEYAPNKWFVNINKCETFFHNIDEIIVQEQ